MIGVGCNWARIQDFVSRIPEKSVGKPVDMSRSYEMKRLCRKAQENIWKSITNEMRPACLQQVYLDGRASQRPSIASLTNWS